VITITDKQAKTAYRFFSRTILALAFVALQSCILYPIAGPGYWTSIEVKDPNFRRENTTPLEEIAVREHFVMVKSVEEPDWYCIYYYSSKDEHRLLGVWISYHQKEQSLRVVVMNDWTGQKMKEEIERVADLYTDAMSRTYGKENLRTIRKRTGPPM
jgi:hypothetical protein